jgi:hypothetical protein
MVLYVVLQIIANNVGLDHNLYVYGGSPRVQYSDMNGAGPSGSELAFRAYWTAIALILLGRAPLVAARHGDADQAPAGRAPARLKGTPACWPG